MGLLWIGVGVLVVILLLAVWVWLQYRRFRRFVPQAPFRETRLAPEPATWAKDDVTVAWVGHSTLYINLFGLRILTDPVFSHRAGVSFGPVTLGPQRHTAPALKLEDVVGHVDVVLLSHAHMDHFDLPTLRRVADEHLEVVTAKGTRRLLRAMKFGHVRELGDTDSVTLTNGLVITAFPVRHWGARFPWNKQYAWTGYVIEYRGVCLLFAGDTAYTSTFGKLRDLVRIDIACMPIGAYAPDSFQGSHCTPEQAWQMFLESGAQWMIPIHWDTFVLSQEPVHEPMERLLHAAGDEQHRIVIREHGDVFQMSSSVEGSTVR
jgi:L-ascorbate metabolism protein UlaG (beta-lactamase superfamily)